MLAPDYLDHAPDRLVLLFQQVEDDILRDVARRISKNGHHDLHGQLAAVAV